ncbi:MAG: hypothetical protein ACOVLK_08755 [Terrimicrobiaceae bacterium]
MASEKKSSKKPGKNILRPSSEQPSAGPASLHAKHLPSRPAQILSWCGFAVILLSCIAYALFHAYLIDQVTLRLCREMDGAQAKPAEVLPVPLLEIAFDGYVWNRHAEKLFQNGEWRVRFTDMDNAPEGREVHWNSGFAWYLRGLGEIYRHFTGDSLRNSIFRMSIWANPILLVLALGLFATLSARRFGPLCGSVLSIGMISTASFYEGFLPAYPDHHGITAFALMGLIFGIAWAGAGWVQKSDGNSFIPPHSLKQARHGMIFSAICGAVGLWISAFSASTVLTGIGLGAIVTTAIFRKSAEKSGSQFEVSLWRIWAIWGAGGSLFLYALEYFPSHLGMRLEVNHPLYALAWLGGGWIIATVCGWIVSARGTPFPFAKLLLPLAACAVLPATILLGGPAVYIPGDEFMAGLWKNIAELLPLVTRIQMGAISWKVAFGYFPAFVVLAIVLAFFRKVDGASKAVLVFLCIPIVMITAMQFYQVRWGMLNGPLYIALAGLVVPQMWRLLPPLPGPRAIGALVLCGAIYLFSADTVRGMVLPFWKQYSSKQNIEVGSGQLLALLHRDMAKKFLENAQGRPVTVLSSPNSSCLLSTFGGFKTIGTLYWENVDGLKSAAHALNAQSPDEALALLQKHGVTHVSLMTWENFIGPYFQIIHPKPVSGKSLENSWGQRALFNKEFPQWVRPIPYPKNFLTNALKQDVVLLEIVPNQSRDEFDFHLARFQRINEGNPIAAEILLKGVLDRNPGVNLVHMELAELFIDQNRPEEANNQILLALKVTPPEGRRSLAERGAQLLRLRGANAQADAVLKAATE